MPKAAVMYGFGEPLRIEDIKLNDPRPDEVVVQVKASGVCHSDLSVTKAVIPVPPPAVLGHEGAGIVQEVGKDVRDLVPGDHVIMSWVENCGKCHYCVAGHGHLCDASIRNSMTGGEHVFQNKDGVPIMRMAGVGSFSETTVVRATAAIKIPKDAPFDKACLVGCGVTTGVGAAFNTARIEPGMDVAVFGCGGVGLNVIQGAAMKGAGKIIAVDLVDKKLQWAKVFGATHTINPKGGDAGDAIRELTNGLGVDYAFEVVGIPALITQAFMSLKRGGKCVVVGVPQMGSTVEIPGFSLPLEEKSVIGSLYGSANLHRDIPLYLDLYMMKKLKLDELISAKIKLEQVNEAFANMEKGEVARSVIVY